MTDRLDKHVLKNGMMILAEPMDGVESVAFTFRLPAGASLLPQGCCGAGSVIIDWLFRGAGKRSSKELVDALDGLGLHRGCSVSSGHITLAAALESSNLAEAMNIYADVILKPSLDVEQFELSKQLAIQGVIGLDDDPRQKVMLELYEQFYPNGLGISAVGKLDELNDLTAETAAGIVKDKFNLSQTVFALAGKYDFQAVCDQLEDLFDIDQPALDSRSNQEKKGQSYTHLQHDGAQVHIGLVTPSVPVASKDYYNARAAVSVLSGGMSSRLFTEVREKRGLCYAIGAQYHSLKDFAGIGCYAGTQPDKAQQTLDVIRTEFDRLCKGVTDDEIQRAKVGLKSSLIMESESSSIRAGGIASDYYLLGRVRSMEEIKGKLDSISAESVETFLNENKFADYTVVTIGPKQVQV